MPCTPMLAYSARGIATLWETATPPAPHAIAALLGRTRAALLAALDQPTSTTHLAQRLSLTPGAISQHLTVLNDCGRVARTRIGRLDGLTVDELHHAADELSDLLLDRWPNCHLDRVERPPS